MNEDKMIGALRKIEDEKSNNESDAEINSMILNDEERKLKTLLWNNLNKQYLEEQHKKKKEEKASSSFRWSHTHSETSSKSDEEN